MDYLSTLWFLSHFAVDRIITDVHLPIAVDGINMEIVFYLFRNNSQSDLSIRTPVGAG